MWIFFFIIQSVLPTDCIVLSKTDAYVKIGVMSYILSNGNQVFKEITFNLIIKNWNLRVRGVTVNLYNLGLSNKFDFTVKSMEDIVYIVKRLKICKGLIVNNKKTILINITVEVLQEVLQNNKESKRTYKSMRCRTCFEVLIMVEHWRCLHSL